VEIKFGRGESGAPYKNPKDRLCRTIRGKTSCALLYHRIRVVFAIVVVVIIFVRRAISDTRHRRSKFDQSNISYIILSNVEISCSRIRGGGGILVGSGSTARSP